MQPTRPAFEVYTEGLKNLSTGHIGEAEAAFLEVALKKSDPGLSFKALQQLGEIAYRFRNFAESLTFLDVAEKDGALSVEAEKAKAVSLFALGCFREAKETFETLQGRHPDDETVIRHLGRMALEEGEAEEALALFEKISTPTAETKVDIGLALEAKREKPAADNHFQSLKTTPATFEALLDEVDQLMMLDLNPAAEKLLAKAEKIAPEDANAWFYIGLRYYTLGNAKAAILAYKKGIKIMPLLVLYQELSSLHEKANDLKSAREALRTPLHYFPQDPKANTVQAMVDFRTGRAALAKTRLEGVLPAAENPYVKADIHNLLGRIHDGAGDYEKAAAAFQTSKDALKTTKEYQELRPKSQLDILDQMQGITPPKMDPKTLPKAEGAPKDLVFFVGFPRSGTTLIENVLAGHPEVITTEERSLLLGPIGLLEKMPGGYPASLSLLNADAIHLLRQRYYREILTFTMNVEDKVLVDKMPLNIMHLPLIRTLFPEAKVLFATRHPYAVALSCLMQNFDLNNAMANLMSADEITAFYEKTMALWAKMTADPDFSYHYVRYEAAVENLEGEARAITDYLGLDYTPKMLNYAKRAKDKGLVHTPSYAQVVKPVYKDALARWKNYQDQFAPFKDRLAPACQLFGYEGL